MRVKDKEGGTFKGLEIHREQRERRVPGLASLAPSSPYICFWAPLMERNFSIHEEVIYQTVAPESSEWPTIKRSPEPVCEAMLGMERPFQLPGVAGY